MTSLSIYSTRIHTALLNQLPAIHQSSGQLHTAMHYAVLNGGKRLRPILVYAVGEMLGAHLEKLDAPACAIEFIHTYSLIHDDLPAMDNDDWRRGKPACHKAFDEATAILAGDALQTLAFACLAQNTILSNVQQLQMIDVLAKASGSLGMAGGQAMDLAATHQSPSLQEIETLYALKTGALINASITLGIITAEIKQQTIIASLNHYAQCIGLAFQIQDDILDIEGNITTLGKQPGSDNKHNKPTYAAVAGLTYAKEKVASLREDALAALNTLDISTTQLAQITDTILMRQ